MTNYWCEDCNNRWQGDYNDLTCPNQECLSREIRKTMSREEAEKRGLTETTFTYTPSNRT